MENNIVYITDEKYAMPTCVSITSLIHNNTKRNKYKVYVLLDRVSQNIKYKFEMLKDKYVSCELIDIDGEKYDKVSKTCMTENIHVTAAALYKFDIAEILRDEDKALYLDGDILINKDIEKLFGIDLSEYYAAAVDDMGNRWSTDERFDFAKRIGINYSYFNSGVMLLNLKKLRDEYMGEKLLWYRTKMPNYFMDQDAFNGILGEKRLPLPFRYNFITEVFDKMPLEKVSLLFCNRKYDSVEECLSNQSILHMADEWKPWKYNIPWITDLFLDYYMKSPYKDNTLQLQPQGLEVNKKLDSLWQDYSRLSDDYQKLHKRFCLATQDSRKIWSFPYSKIKKGSRIILYGAGDVGHDMHMQIKVTDYCDVILWVDKNWASMGDEQVTDPENIQDYTYDYVVIAISKDNIVREVDKYLKSIGVAENKIVKMDIYEEY